MGHSVVGGRPRRRAQLRAGLRQHRAGGAAVHAGGVVHRRADRSVCQSRALDAASAAPSAGADLRGGLVGAGPAGLRMRGGARGPAADAEGISAVRRGGLSAGGADHESHRGGLHASGLCGRLAHRGGAAGSGICHRGGRGMAHGAPVRASSRPSGCAGGFRACRLRVRLRTRACPRPRAWARVRFRAAGGRVAPRRRRFHGRCALYGNRRKRWWTAAPCSNSPRFRSCPPQP